MGWSEEDMCPNPGQVGVFEFRVGVGEERRLLCVGGGRIQGKNERERHEC